MIKYNQLKVGDYVVVEYEGTRREGEVIQLNGDEKQACILSGDQKFWFELQHLYPIKLDEQQLFRLGFQKQLNDDGSVKYAKGAFRMMVQKPEQFTDFEMWYREDRRHKNAAITVHEFQNLYYDMTKVHLTEN